MGLPANQTLYYHSDDPFFLPTVCCLTLWGYEEIHLQEHIHKILEESTIKDISLVAFANTLPFSTSLGNAAVCACLLCLASPTVVLH